MNPRGELNDCQFPKPVYFLNFAPIYLLLYAQICVGLFPTPKKPLLFFFFNRQGIITGSYNWSKQKDQLTMRF